MRKAGSGRRKKSLELGTKRNNRRDTPVCPFEARNIHLWHLNGLFVFGDLTCDKIHLREGYPLYVQGNLIARQAILATAEQEGPSSDQEQFGPSYVRIKGRAFSPRVQTWFMPLHHLNWAADSGKELAEDKVYSSDKYLADPIWKF